MARGLFPGDLRADGIADALRELAIRTQDVFGVSCRFSGPPAVRLADDSVARQVYRIAQEAVHNAARHSGARTIRIRLSRRRGRVALVVRDAGIGIRGGAAAEGGMGQRIMKYRADMIGAALRIESARGKGTVVTCVLPPACPREKARRRPPRQRIPPRRAPARE
jgi:signal transduction histidine kinase